MSKPALLSLAINITREGTTSHCKDIVAWLKSLKSTDHLIEPALTLVTEFACLGHGLTPALQARRALFSGLPDRYRGEELTHLYDIAIKTVVSESSSASVGLAYHMALSNSFQAARNGQDLPISIVEALLAANERRPLAECGNDLASNALLTVQKNFLAKSSVEQRQYIHRRHLNLIRRPWQDFPITVSTIDQITKLPRLQLVKWSIGSARVFFEAMSYALNKGLYGNDPLAFYLRVEESLDFYAKMTALDCSNPTSYNC